MLARYLAITFLIFSLAAEINAQVTTGIGGRVTDESGAVLSDLSISFLNIDTGLRRNAVTDERGNYQVNVLPPGTYDIRAEREGFVKYNSRITTTVGQSLVLDIKMRVKGIQAEVEVRPTPPTLEPRKTELSIVVETTDLDRLPISGRNFIDIVKLSSSAVTTGRDIRGGGAITEPDTGIGIAAAPRLSFGGQREYYTMIAIDGVDNTQTVTGLTRAVPSADAIREFRIVNGSYSTEFGRTLGGLINIITKSGTTTYHGDAYYFFIDDAFKARSTLKRPQADFLRQNQFGMSLGGPIKGDKLLFFLNYEGQRFATSNQFADVIVSNLESINRVRRGFGLSAETADLLKTNDYDQFLIKTDYRLNAQHNLYFRYNFVDSKTQNFLGAAGRSASASSSARNSFLDDGSFVVSAVSTLNQYVNEGRFQYARRSFRYPSVRNEPTLELPNLITMGKSTSDVDAYRESRWQWTNSVGYVKRTHNIKVGFDLNILNDQARWEVFFPARVIFPSLAGFLGLPPFQAPTPVAFQWSAAATVHPGLNLNFERAVPAEWDEAVTYRFRQSYYGFFAQDQWHVTPKLTLSYGLREDFDSFPKNTFRSDFFNLQPRAGLAYSVNDRMVLRAGFGVYASRRTTWSTIVPGAILGIRGVHPVARGLGDFFPLDATVSNFILSGPALAGPALNNLLTSGTFPSVANAKQIAVPIEAGNQNPYSEHGSLSFAYQPTENFAISTDYLFVHGLKLQGNRNVNAFQNGVAADGRPLFGGKHDPDFLFIQSAPNWGTSTYHGGTLNLKKRFDGWLRLDANYTFSKTIDDVGGSHDIGAMPMYVSRKLERALSNQHVGHRFTLGVLTEASKKGLLRGFRFSPVLTLESPRYFTVYVGSDSNLDGNPLNDRPGSLGRNTFKGDNYVSLDARISRTFQLSERVRGELIVDGFNIFNTLNVKDFNTVYGAVNLSVPPSPALGFGQPREIFEPRLIQFAFKLAF